MIASDLTMTFLVDQSPEEVFNAVTNVRGWWSAALEGNSAAEGDEFTYRHKDIHYSRHTLTEVIPNERVVWLTNDSRISFVEKTDEWNDTRVSFDISKQGDKTQLVFTHHGLVPELQCYKGCSGGWGYYIAQSLLPLITTGTGRPDGVEK